jgi:hypothetical protein
MYEDFKKSTAWIETASGKQLHIANPVFDIEDIAYSLSNICRYTGHCKRFYSVAEHSALVSEIMGLIGGSPLEGLLHDATESVLADVSSPIKALLPDYKRLETYLDTAVRAQFNLPPSPTPECKRADTIALYIETQKLVPSMGTDWPCFDDDIKNEGNGMLQISDCVSIYPGAGQPRVWRKIFVDYFRSLTA